MGRLSSRADWAWRKVRAGLTGTGPCHAGSSFQGRLNPLDGEKAERLDAGVQLGGPILSPSSNMRVSPPPPFNTCTKQLSSTSWGSCNSARSDAPPGENLRRHGLRAQSYKAALALTSSTNQKSRVSPVLLTDQQ